MFNTNVIRFAAIALGVLVNFECQLHAHIGEGDPNFPSLKQIAAKAYIRKLQELPEGSASPKLAPFTLAERLVKLECAVEVMDAVLAGLPSRTILEILTNKSARELINQDPNLTDRLVACLPESLTLEQQVDERQETLWQFSCWRDDFGDSLAVSLSDVLAIPLRHLTLNPSEAWGCNVFKSISDMKSIAKLSLANPLNSAQAEALFCSQNSLPSLVGLDFNGIDTLSTEAAHALRSSPSLLERLRVLEVYQLDNQLGEHWEPLINAMFRPENPSLVRLSIAFEADVEYLSSSLFHRLSAFKGASSLARLGLMKVRMDLTGAQALGRVGFEGRFPCLRSVSLSDCQISAESLEALLPFFTHAKKINLRGNHFGNEGVEALAGSPCVANVESLCLNDVGMDCTGLRSLLQSTHLKGLELMDISYNNLGLEGGRLIGEILHTHLPNVISLDITGTRLLSEGVKLMVSHPGVGQLRTLHLWEDMVEESIILAIADSQHLGNLEVLLLGNARLSSQVLEHFLRRSNLTSLRELGLSALYNNDYDVRELLTRLREERVPLAALIELLD